MCVMYILVRKIIQMHAMATKRRSMVMTASCIRQRQTLRAHLHGHA